MKTAVYIRVSTVGQNEAGELAEIDKWLAGNGIADAAYYVDRETGENLDRPEFIRLQADIFAGQVKMVVVYKRDRLSRSLRDRIDTLCNWIENSFSSAEIIRVWPIRFCGPCWASFASLSLARHSSQKMRQNSPPCGSAS